MSKNCVTHIHRTGWKWHSIWIHIYWHFGHIYYHLDKNITIWTYILQFGHIYCNLDINMETRHIYIWLFNILILFDKHTEAFPTILSVIRVIDSSDRNPPITATSMTFWPSLRHASGLWLVDYDPICQSHVWLTEILETFPLVFSFPKSRINENGGNSK